MRNENESFEITMGVRNHRGVPCIESRARPLGMGDRSLPRGKILILRTPILPPGASEEEIEALTERELVDDDGAFCPLCAGES